MNKSKRLADQRSDRLTVTVTRSERARLEEAAASARLSLSTWARIKLLESIEGQRKFLKDSKDNKA